MNFQSLAGRTIAVDFAVPKEQFRTAAQQPKEEIKEEEPEAEQEPEETEATEEGTEEARSDIESEEGDEEDNDEEGEEKEEDKKEEEEEGTTLFIRNLDLETERHTLFEKYFASISSHIH
jgi:nucleolar protein 4